MNEFLRNFLSNPTAIRLVAIGLGSIAVFVVIRLIKRLAKRYVKDNNNLYRAGKAINILGYLLVVSIILFVYNDKLGGVSVALGVAGAGIAFALQEVIISVAGWISIMFGGTLKTGDRVQLGGIVGDVIDIGVLKTTIMELGQWVNGDLYNGRIVTVANSFVFKEPVYNYSADFPFLWDEIILNLEHGSNIIKAKEILSKVGWEVTGDYVEFAKSAWAEMTKKYLIENATVDPTVTLIVDENTYQLTLRYVVDGKKRRITKDQLFTQILQLFQENSIEVSFATSTLSLVKPDPVTVSVK